MSEVKEANAEPSDPADPSGATPTTDISRDVAPTKFTREYTFLVEGKDLSTDIYSFFTRLSDGGKMHTRRQTDAVRWTMFLDDDAVVNEIKEHPAVRAFEVKDAPLSKRGKPFIRRQQKIYVVYPTDPTNIAQVNKTQQLLEDIVLDEHEEITRVISARPKMDRFFSHWSGLTFDDAGLDKARGLDGVSSVEEPHYVNYHRTLPTVQKRVSIIDWKMQKIGKQIQDLKVVSQYKGAALDSLNKYVYESHGGSKGWIYLVDRGVDAGRKSDLGDEFPSSRFHFYKTPACKEDPKTDDNEGLDAGHGTHIASKAAGTKFGVAKNANFVSVKHAKSTNSDEIFNAFRVIEDDLRKFPEREKTAVVLMSAGVVDNGNQEMRRRYKEWMNSFLSVGVPVVFSSGNDRAGSDRINELPQVLAKKWYPIINVGGIERDGSRASFSQGGDEWEVPIHAPGTLIDCQGANSDGEIATVQGTSFSAPFVAGLIANYMSYDTQPWLEEGKPEPTKIARVGAIRDYIKDDRSSFVRLDGSGIRVLWNGATVHAHDDADSLTDPAIKCNGLRVELESDNKRQEATSGSTTGYITRDTLSALIDNDACPQLPGLVAAGSKEPTYLDNTPEKVAISMDPATDGQAIPSVDDCKQHMHEIRDGCDGNNAMNWKAGGSYTFDGWTYSITPKGERPPAPQAPSAWCELHDDVIRMWGAGCLNSGHGKELKDALVQQDYLVADTDFSFQYELKDGHEWQASVVNRILEPNPYTDSVGIVEQAMTQAINWSSLKVQCTR